MYFSLHLKCDEPQYYCHTQSFSVVEMKIENKLATCCNSYKGLILCTVKEEQ